MVHICIKPPPPLCKPPHAQVIDAVLLDIVIYPKQIKIPLVPTSAGEAHAQPIGILILTLERAINLKKNTYFMGTTDPYCVIDTAQQQFRSRVTCGKARWDETFEIMVYDLDSQCLSISVFDADPGFDKALGKVEVLLRNTRPNQLFQKTLDLEGGQGQGSQGQCGQLLVSYEYLPVRGPDDSDSDSCDGDSCDDEILYRFSREQLTDHILHSEEELLAIQFPQQHSVGPGGGSVGIVTISNMHLRNFKASSLLFTSALKPFVEVSLMGKVKCTRSQPGTTLPHFPETFSFVVRHAERLKLRVEVRNKRKLSLLNAQSLGWVEIPLSDVVENSGLREQEYLMDGTNHECYVSLKISLSSSFQD
ncbi:C2 domain-containing protein [Ochromonadaceae sp. CCMP2298]|nr:C2 domain-containing protein [Ochromonadaceae sp. CCMP2298]